MADLKKMFPEQQKWWLPPCDRCNAVRKARGVCSTSSCPRFELWFRGAWKKACAGVRERAKREHGEVEEDEDSED